MNDYQEFLGGESAYSPEIWRIVCTELWLRKFFDRKPGSPGRTSVVSPELAG
jgi:hypothetical protein